MSKDANTNSYEALVDLLTTIALPLASIDEAILYVVDATDADVHLHLGGTYSGCPGVPFVERHLLAPLVAEVFPKAKLTVTSGLPLPKSARRL